MKRIIFTTGIIILFSFFLLGNTIYVAPEGNGNGVSWDNPIGNLNHALSIAREGDQIWIKKGTYKPTKKSDRNSTFAIPNGVKLYGGFLGHEKSITERNLSNKTTLSGEIGESGPMDNVYTILLIKNVDNSTIIDGFIISGGSATLNSSEIRPESCGGGVFNIAQNGNSNPVFSNCIFKDNLATKGAAILNHSENGISNPTFNNCSFFSNIGSMDGGALYNIAKSGQCKPEFIDCNFSKNEATYGGGIYNTMDTGAITVKFNNCRIEDNMAYYHGGAFYNDNNIKQAKITMIDTVIVNNYPDNGSLTFYKSKSFKENGSFKSSE